jgi:hypothetical protein
VKGKRPRLAEVQIQSPSDSVAPLAGAGIQKAFTIHLPQGASVLVPAGFDPDELMALLVVLQEALA